MKAISAVAVDKGLLESRPSHTPSGVRRASKAAMVLRAARSRVISKAQMPQGEQSIVGIFAIENFVGPTADESAAGGPQRIEEIEGGLANRIERRVQADQRMQGGGGGKQIGDGGREGGEESARGMLPLKQPGSDFRGHRLIEMPQQSDGSGGCRRQT